MSSGLLFSDFLRREFRLLHRIFHFYGFLDLFFIVVVLLDWVLRALVIR
jgi:hypothetical protein